MIQLKNLTNLYLKMKKYITSCFQGKNIPELSVLDKEDLKLNKENTNIQPLLLIDNKYSFYNINIINIYYSPLLLDPKIYSIYNIINIINNFKNISVNSNSPIKLLAPDIHYIYDIYKDEDLLPIIHAFKRNDIVISMGINIKFFILDLLAEMFNLLPTKRRLNIIINIKFHTETFENGSKEYEIFKNEKKDLKYIQKKVKKLIYKLHEIYGITYIFDIKIDIIYGYG